MKFLKILFLTFALSPLAALAQELNFEVQVQAPNVQVTDPAVFRDLEQAVYEFLNNRRWTGDNYQNYERINGQLIITITEELSTDKFNASLTIQSSRPVYNSDYKTPLLYYEDKDFSFEYSPFQPLEFNENAHLSNLTSVLAYYVYLIIGLDYDSFAPEGGTPYFLKAQSIANIAQSANESDKGWKPYESNRNRYWIMENLLNSRFKKFRTTFYEYHLNGLDRMYEDRRTATSAVSGNLAALAEVERDAPNSMIMQLFFTAKIDELVNIFQGAPPPEKVQAVNMLTRLDPANTEKYQLILR